MADRNDLLQPTLAPVRATQARSKPLEDTAAEWRQPRPAKPQPSAPAGGAAKPQPSAPAGGDPFHSLHIQASRHTAVCSTCGWQGPQRTTFERAAQDAIQHEKEPR
jgi:hypothetical protein